MLPRSRWFSTAAMCGVLLLLPAVASAGTYKVTVKNVDPHSSLVVQRILWTKNNQPNGETAVSWVIPPNTTQTRTFNAPAGTTDHGIAAVMSSGAWFGM